MSPVLLFFALAAEGAPNAAEYIADVKALAGEEMRGRGAGMPELDKAADYIISKFRKIGVEPAGENGFRQPFQVTTGAEMGAGNRLVVNNRLGEQKLEPGVDYIPISFSSSGEVWGNVVFAGYGVSASDKGYDDYLHFDVADKIVIVLRYEPPSLMSEGRGGRRRHTHHANLISKAIAARNRGAKAVILVNGKTEDGKDELIQFGSVAGPDNGGIPMIQVSNDIVDGWLRRSGKSLELLQRDIDASGQPQSFELAEAFSLDLRVNIERKQATVSNVVGYIPGKSDEYVIVGAHYDHLGLGDQSSLAPDKIGQVHHGADDNASGAAGLIEIARRFTALPQKPERGLLLIAFAGEEIGLLGSAHWVEHPTRPLDQAVAMLNMDMIGRIDEGKVYVGGTGTAEPFDALLKKVAAEYAFKIDYSESGYSASDHTSFTAKQVPVLFFFSGLHGDYHKPSDTWDKIDGASAVELVDMVGRIAGELQQLDARPEFVRATSMGPHGAAPPGSSSGGGGYGPYFGSIPDFGQVPSGVRFADVRPDSPADKGGLQGGDIMTGFDGKPITNLYDFTYALRETEVGQTVTVKYLRDGQEHTTQVTLEQRR